jgi:hypothetical protein
LLASALFKNSQEAERFPLEVSATESTGVAESLNRKYDFQSATGHYFFCLKHGFAVTIILF